MAYPATLERCLNCALLLLPLKDTVKPRTPRVEELLRHNYPPLDIELSTFRKVAEDTRTTLEDLDSKIGLTQELLENLLSVRQQAQSRLEDATSILHPMRSIPCELLTQIFQHCVPTAFRPEDPDVLDTREAPWLFSGVCRRWRELVVNTPQLWTHLILDIDKHVGHITDRQCAYKVGLFLERSRGLPIEVYFGSTKNVTGHPVIPVLEVSIPRWRSLDIDIPQDSLRFFSGNSFLRLQTLCLRPPISDLSFDVFQPTRAPVLRDFELLTCESWRTFRHVPFPWSHLTSVTNFPAFDPEALNSLRTMTGLRELGVLAWASSEAYTPIQDVISLPKLRHLTILEDEDAAGRSEEFFCALAAPALLELTLGYHATSVLHFPMLPLPLGNLIKLVIICEMDAHEENTQNLLNFLTFTHQVESLTLYDLNMTLEFADGLNLDKIPDGSPVMLPCLRSLDIHECAFASALDNDLDRLFDMFFSRLPVVTVDGTLGEEKTDASFGQVAAANGGFDRSPRSDSEVDHRRSLKRVQLGRALYVLTRTEWPDLFLSLASSVELEGI